MRHLARVSQNTCCPVFVFVSKYLLLKQYLHPLLLLHPYSVKPMLHDQFAFRPTGSTTSALISLLDKITVLLDTNPYVHLITFDFSKAFDTVSHAPLMSRIAAVGFPDNIFNWIANFLTGRVHRTTFDLVSSNYTKINAGVVQGSAIGPSAFSFCVSTYRPCTSGNLAMKYADDMYLIVPASNTSSIKQELDNIASWASECNLKLNQSKSAEMIIRKPRSKVPCPPLLNTLPRVESLKVLGVTLQYNLSMTEHVSNVVARSSQILYALKTVKAHGLPAKQLSNVTVSTMVSALTYASPAWYGFASAEDLSRLQAPIKRATKWGLLNLPSSTSFASICIKADISLFSNILASGGHVLHSMLPPRTTYPYRLRPRRHDFTLPPTTNLLQKNFFHRMLYFLSGTA